MSAGIRWPWVSRKAQEAIVERNARTINDVIQASADDIKNERADHARVVADLTAKHQDDLAEVATHFEQQRDRELHQFMAAMNRAVIGERQSCHDIVERLPASARGSFIRGRALLEIRGRAKPNYVHPDASQPEASASTAASTSTAPAELSVEG